jgi:hypothetical protein
MAKQEVYCYEGTHHGHILHYVKGLTEEDKQWIGRMARTIYYKHEKLQRFEGTIFEDVGMHIALSFEQEAGGHY